MAIPTILIDSISSILRYKCALLRTTLYTGNIPRHKKVQSIIGLCVSPKGNKNKSGVSKQ